MLRLVLPKGSLEKSTMELFASAGSGSECKYNQGLLNIQQGLYEEAINNMGDNKTFNVALATLLSGDAEGASQVIDASNTSDDAISYYLKAIIGSRTNNSAMLMDNSLRDIRLIRNGKNKAKIDREFIQFFENADFLAIF